MMGFRMKKIIVSYALMLAFLGLCSSVYAGDELKGMVTHIGVQNGTNAVQIRLSATNEVFYLRRDSENSEFESIYAFLLANWSLGQAIEIRVTGNSPRIISGAYSPSYF